MKMELEEYEHRMKDKSDITALTGKWSVMVHCVVSWNSPLGIKYVLITCTCTSTYNLYSLM